MYDISFRKAAVALYSYFHNMKTVAAALHIGIATLWRWVRIGILPKKRGVAPFPPALLAFIKAFVLKQVHCTHSEVRSAVQSSFGHSISRACVSTAFKILNFTRKRIQNKGQSSKTVQSDKYISFKAACVNETTVVSVDEVGFDQRTTPIYGYAPRGQKAIVLTHPTRRVRTNAIVGIDRHGCKHFHLKDGSVASSDFASFIKSSPWQSGTVVILDNVAFHKTAEVKEAMQTKGYIPAFIPPYSPDFNPIENVFSVIKNSFRKRNADGSITDVHAVLSNIFMSLDHKVVLNCFLRWDKLLKTI